MGDNGVRKQGATHVNIIDIIFPIEFFNKD